MSFARAVIPVGIAAMRAMNSAVPTLCYLLSAVVLPSYHNNYGEFKEERIISSNFFNFFLPIKIPHLHIHVVIHSVFTSFLNVSYPLVSRLVPFSLPSLFPLKEGEDSTPCYQLCVFLSSADGRGVGFEGTLYEILMMISYL